MKAPLCGLLAGNGRGEGEYLRIYWSLLLRKSSVPCELNDDVSCRAAGLPPSRDKRERAWSRGMPTVREQRLRKEKTLRYDDRTIQLIRWCLSEYCRSSALFFNPSFCIRLYL